MICDPNPPSDKVIVSSTLSDATGERFNKYLMYALCLEGKASFRYHDSRFAFSKGDLLIVRFGKMIEDLDESPDFKVKCIFIDKSFADLANPNTNYTLRSSISAFLNPVIHLSECAFAITLSDMECVEQRHTITCYRFYTEALRCAVQLMVLDVLEFHSNQTSEIDVSPQLAHIMESFFKMLSDGFYREHREVAYYASKLCITPKYLSEVSKKTSGHPANFWIHRYTAIDISRRLRDKKMTIQQIADMFHFSSSAYFSRYVQHNLGLSPSDFRD